MKIIRQFIYNDENNKLSAADFWKWTQENSDTLGLKLLGFAKPKIRIIKIDNKLGLSLDFATEIGILNNIDMIELEDYFVFKNNWIPIDLNLFNPILNELNNLNIKLHTPISIGKIYKFISVIREFQIDIIDEVDLKNFKIEPTDKLNVELAHKLYEYQIVGINWLIELAKQQVGGLLCDEMGLGKTVQAFGLIKYLKSQNDAKILIVTPASLTINWSRELEKFVPELNYYLHQGPQRLFHPSDLESQNLIIVSYEILTKDFNNFNKVNWDLVICDEAQNLKNSNSKRHISVSNLRCINKFLVTGTPIENSLTDLWSLINIVRPGLLGDIRNFQLLINDHPSDAKKLSNFAAPLILRRRVKDVAKDLPELVTKELILNGTDSFINFYENRRIELINTKSNSLAALTELIQICCYPGLIDSKYQDAHDAKINETLEILRNIKSNDEKAIVFTTFKSSLDLLSTVISKQLSPNFCSIIDGRIAANRRYEIISKFNNIDGFCVLLIQPKAGGTGLNITSANHVIHFNRQWNPAIERQATARSYRRGQTRTVFEYLISYAGTVEEYISDTLYRKSVLAHYGTEQSEIEGSDKDIQKALELSPLI